MSDNKSIKETQKNRIEEFFDNKTLRTNPFGDNVSAEYGYRRAERISAAVYLMTSHIEHVEPIRISLRSESILLLDHALLLQGELRAIGSENVRKMQASIRKLISLIRLAGISGRVSAQNASILSDALDDLGNFLSTSQRSILAESVALTREDLVPRSNQKKETVLERSTKQPQGRISAHEKTIKDKIIVKDTKSVRNGAPSESRSERIIDVLRAGGLLGIKDVVANLPEYSEKMIQRDLSTLAEAGRVRKIGAKRWSKYTLV